MWRTPELFEPEITTNAPCRFTREEWQATDVTRTSAHPTKLELGKTILRLAGRQATPGLFFIGGSMIVSSGEDRIRRTPEEGSDLQKDRGSRWAAESWEFGQFGQAVFDEFNE